MSTEIGIVPLNDLSHVDLRIWFPLNPRVKNIMNDLATLIISCPSDDIRIFPVQIPTYWCLNPKFCCLNHHFYLFHRNLLLKSQISTGWLVTTPLFSNRPWICQCIQQELDDGDITPCLGHNPMT